MTFYQTAPIICAAFGLAVGLLVGWSWIHKSKTHWPALHGTGDYIFACLLTLIYTSTGMIAGAFFIFLGNPK